jgi:hypothetical protein
VLIVLGHFAPGCPRTCVACAGSVISAFGPFLACSCGFAGIRSHPVVSRAVARKLSQPDRGIVAKALFLQAVHRLWCSRKT